MLQADEKHVIPREIFLGSHNPTGAYIMLEVFNLQNGIYSQRFKKNECT